MAPTSAASFAAPDRALQAQTQTPTPATTPTIATASAAAAPTTRPLLEHPLELGTFLPSYYDHTHARLADQSSRAHIQAGPSLFRGVRLARTPPLQTETLRRPTYNLPPDVAASLAPPAPTWQPKPHTWDETSLFDAMNDPAALLPQGAAFPSLAAGAWPGQADAVDGATVGPAEFTQALLTYRHIQAALAHVQPRALPAPPATDALHTVDALLQYATDGIRLLVGQGQQPSADEPARPAKRTASETLDAGAKAGRNDKSKAKPVCQGCGATETPEWRRGPLGPRTLCNACGLVHMKMLRKKKKQDEKAAAAAAAAAGAIKPA